MFDILTFNAISKKGLAKLPADKFTISDTAENPQGILVRSGDMHSYTPPASLLAVARAGAGTNNIPLDSFATDGIVVFNTPGANANAVKELVITAMLISSRKIIDGIFWAQTLKGKQDVEDLVETGKNQFVGPEIKGKKLGVMGLGAIGVMVANTAVHLGMDVIGYDPFLSVQSAWNISSKVELATSVEQLVSDCDFITLHIPLNAQTKNLFNKNLFSVAKDGLRLLNFSRGGLVETTALKDAIASGKVAKYVTDFPDAQVLELENVIAIPHLGASTPESEENCAEMAALQIGEFLEYGNIKNSVNYPDCQSPYTGKARIAIAHKNIPNMVGSIASTFAKEKLNIDNMLNKSRGDFAYTLVDLDTLHNNGDAIVTALSALDGVIKARIVKEI